MAKMTVQVEVAKEAHELGNGCAEIVLAVKEALADGWQVGTDVPAIVTAALAHLAPAVTGMDQLDDEWATDPVSVVNAATLSGSKLLGAFLKKEEEPSGE